MNIVDTSPSRTPGPVPDAAALRPVLALVRRMWREARGPGLYPPSRAALVSYLRGSRVAEYVKRNPGCAAAAEQINDLYWVFGPDAFHALLETHIRLALK